MRDTDGSAPVVARAREAGMRVRADLSMCFGDPWDGIVPLPQVVSVASRMMALGCSELSLGDTIGVATIDASAGGLGGCPYARSATGNLATEDLLWQLNGLGIDTGSTWPSSWRRAAGWPSGWAVPALAPSGP